MNIECGADIPLASIHHHRRVRSCAVRGLALAGEDVVLSEPCRPGWLALDGGHLCECVCPEEQLCLLRCLDHLTHEGVGSVGREQRSMEMRPEITLDEDTEVQELIETEQDKLEDEEETNEA